jgi:DNA-binding NarL/FixJ family response regulator
MIDPRKVPIDEVVQMYQSLSDRQAEAAEFMVQGLGAKQIGPKLGISPRTAELHIKAVLGKFNVPRANQAAVLIYRAQEFLKCS